MDTQEKKPEYPDKERDETLIRLKSKDWACCEKCDWFYKTSVLNVCPMCRHPWRQKIGYTQPPYESSGLTA